MERVLPAIEKESTLLTLTENASTIVKDIAAQQGGSESTGLRISSEDPVGLTVAAAQQPLPGDQTVAAGGALIYLDEPASQQLDDQVLDASVDEAGRVQFALAPQA